MRHELSGFLSTNLLPPSTILNAANGLLTEYDEELKMHLAELKKLQALVQGVQDRVKATQQSIVDCQTVLSPARRLTDDVLGEIFYNCLPRHRNSLILPSDAPLLLTQVCSSWRAVALSSPRLWSRLHISFPGNMPASKREVNHRGMYSNLDLYTQRIIAAYPSVMTKRCEAVEVWLKRSGSCPLSLSLMYPLLHPVRVKQPIDGPTDDLFDTLIPFCGRWKNLELTMPYSVYSKFQAKFTLDKVPSLTHLRAYIPDRRNRPEDTTKSAIDLPLLSAPTLRSASLYLPTMGTATFSAMNNPTKMMPVWEQLTELFLYASILDTDLWRFLDACKNLVACRFIVHSRDQWGYDLAGNNPQIISTSNEDEAQEHGTIFLPHLQLFGITDDGVDKTMSSLYRSIEAPSLRHVDYRRSGFREYLNSQTDNGQPAASRASPAIAFLEMAQTIDSLAFEPRGISEPDVLTSLKKTNKLRHLALGRSSLVDDDSTHRGTSRFRLPRDNFFIEPFIVQEGASLENGDDIPLPYLETFESHMPFNVSDDDLLKFIRSRLGRAAAQSGVSRLQRVKVYFDRTSQADIAEEVRKCAEEAGQKIELDLDYGPDESITRRPLSVKFGMMERSERSWIYPDSEH
ncbi:hypothetical protein NLJ89_g6750 [Agrocybe chaxingu]|uniref:F-box domain-containing protein n=1 Tax=Agrocybe chaxingu TaxID=84603 RepID=A0A9W8JYJ0_9AGAR|nr:hypothetical protein NLJ89_g6750 [Agrocybe chaxingu]